MTNQRIKIRLARARRGGADKSGLFLFILDDDYGHKQNNSLARRRSLCYFALLPFNALHAEPRLLPSKSARRVLIVT